MREFHPREARCVTCQWWGGDRLAGPTGRLYTPRHAATGVCGSPLSWWAARPRQAESLCAFWHPWERIRGLGHGRGHLGLIMLGPAMPIAERRERPAEP